MSSKIVFIADFEVRMRQFREELESLVDSLHEDINDGAESLTPENEAKVNPPSPMAKVPETLAKSNRKVRP